MNDDMQKQFVGWLAQKLQAKDEQDLKSKMQQLGQDGIKQAYNQFMQEQSAPSQGGQPDQGVPIQKLGGKLDYLLCLKAYKKGGAMAMKDCGCDKSKEMKSGGIVEDKNKAPMINYVDQRKDGKGNGMGKKAYKQDDKHPRDNNPGKKDWMELGKKKKEHTAVTKVPKGKEGMITPAQKKMIAMKEMDEKKSKMKKHQMGGALSPSNPLMVEKRDGSIGQWGNALPPNPSRSYALSNTSAPGAVGQITEEQLAHLRKNVPMFDHIVGQPFSKTPGSMPTYSDEASYQIRQMLGKYPMQMQQDPALAGQRIAGN